MLRISKQPAISTTAPGLLGAILLAVAVLLPACERKNDRETPPPATVGEAATAKAPAPAPSAPKPAAVAASPASSASAAAAPAAAGPSPGLRFVSFNIENWLTTDRYIDDKKVSGKPKPDDEKQAVVSIIASAHPNVVGVCEIGSPADLADLQDRLAAAGVALPHVHYGNGGTDDTRHLALLSHFPIVARENPANTEYQLAGRTFGIQRGILDTTIDTGEHRVRILGVHFKSKRPSREADQEQMRRHEAELLREHIETIFAADPEARLIVHGDFNDTRRTPAVRAVQGAFNSPEFLTALRLEDSRGHVWTQFWRTQDIYSRFDFAMLSRTLLPDVDSKAGRVLDPENWLTASDHRALLVVFRPLLNAPPAGASTSSKAAGRAGGK